MRYFISYTHQDSSWANWIGYIIQSEGHTVYLHEWEIEAGGNIPAWMERRLEEADRVLAVVSAEYLKEKPYSKSERLAAYWESPVEGPFLIPIVVTEISELPILMRNLKRIHLCGMVEAQAEAALVEFLKPPTAPTERPAYPGHSS